MFIESAFKQGICYLNSGGFRKADAYFSEIDLKRAEDADIYLLAGKLFEKAGNQNLALKYYQKAKRLDPERIGITYSQ